MVSSADLIPAPHTALAQRRAELTRAAHRHQRRQQRRKRALGTLAIFSVAGLLAAYIGPLGSMGEPADAAEPAAVSQYATTLVDAQALATARSGDVALDRAGFTYEVYVKPKPTPTPTPVPASSSSRGSSFALPTIVPDAGSAQSIAYGMVAARGWGEGEFSCLVALWNRESGWRVNAHNRSSGAYGIPQSLPGSKMASAGADWQTNPATQISWGLGYIASRYGAPCGAWGHSQARGWY